MKAPGAAAPDSASSRPPATHEAFASGKLILLGEHAVVHGHPALAGAIDRGVSLRAEPGRGAATALHVAGWDLTLDCGSPEAPAEHPVAQAIACIQRALGLTGGFALSGHSDLPPGAGLGSSAALAVATARALAACAGRAVTTEQIAAIANQAERSFHSNPSGVDVALATCGGLGLYRRGAGLQPLHAAPLELAVGLSGTSRPTAAMVEQVAHARAADPAAVDLHLHALGAAAEQGAEALCSAALDALGAAMDRAHTHLAALQLSTPALDALVQIARQAGALGAKLTGGGGGGAVIALAPGRTAALCAAWERSGFRALSCRVGVRPGDAASGDLQPAAPRPAEERAP
jgi:mevalonate kinase